MDNNIKMNDFKELISRIFKTDINKKKKVNIKMDKVKIETGNS